MLREIGTTEYKTSKEGGGEFCVIGHINCPRCKTIIEEREVIHPSKSQRRGGSYYERYSWCYKCGLYNPENDTKKYIISS